MNLYELLRIYNCRISYGGSNWVVIEDEIQGFDDQNLPIYMFTVYHRGYHQKKAIVLYQGTDEKVAIHFLLGE